MYWYEKSSFYHIYPLGYFGCPKDNDYKVREGNIKRLIPRIPELRRLGFNAIYFGPLFDSVAHGYDTVDYTKIDPRLGTNADFAEVTAALHEAGISVVVDGVFNHVGRNFKQFKDVRENRNSPYKDWFYIHDGNSNYNDGFWYEGWEGHFELVKLNLQNPAVRDYLKSCVSGWIDEFGIDGLRLDVAYCLDLQFLRELRTHCKTIRADFWLMGETLHGDYNVWMNPEMLDSVTNYECYKGLWSSFCSVNLFEIAHSIRRQEGLYHGKKMFTFLDNHDVSRIATMLQNKNQLYPLYTLLYTMLGIPSVYYGSEYGQLGDKGDGDYALRPEFVQENYDINADLPTLITKLARFKRMSVALADGDYRELHLECPRYAFSREKDGERVVTAINAGSDEYSFNLELNGDYVDVISGRSVRSPVTVPPCSAVTAVNRPSLVRDIYLDIAACGGNAPDLALVEFTRTYEHHESESDISFTRIPAIGGASAPLPAGTKPATPAPAPATSAKPVVPAAPAKPVTPATPAKPASVTPATPTPVSAPTEPAFTRIPAATPPAAIPPTPADVPKPVTMPKPAEKISPPQTASVTPEKPKAAANYGVGTKQVRALYDFSVLLDNAPAEAAATPPLPPPAVKVERNTLPLPLPKEGIVSKLTSALRKPGKVKAVLLDMDGTVLDTEPVHLEAWREAFKDDALHYPDGFLESWVGMNEAQMMKSFYNEFGDVTLFYQLRYKMSVFNHKLSTNGIPVKKGFDKLADYAAHNGIKLYVVTSSFAGAASRDLKAAGIFDKISGIIGCDDVENGKPNPEGYLRAISLAGVGKDECIAVEDSTLGIRAASAAGVEVVYVPDIAAVAADTAELAKYRCADLAAVADVIAARGK